MTKSRQFAEKTLPDRCCTASGIATVVENNVAMMCKADKDDKVVDRLCLGVKFPFEERAAGQGNSDLCFSSDDLFLTSALSALTTEAGMLEQEASSSTTCSEDARMQCCVEGIAENTVRRISSRVGNA